MDPAALGVRPRPQKSGFYQIYLLRGFWCRGVVSHHFRIGSTRQTQCWDGNFELWPTAPNGWAGRGANQNFGFSTFCIKGTTPPKISRRLLLVICNFLIQSTPRAPRVPWGLRRGENQKSKLGYFYFVLFIFDSRHPEALQARQNPQKGAQLQFRKIKVQNLGSCIKQDLKGTIKD